MSGERDLPGEGKASNQESRVCQTARREKKTKNENLRLPKMKGRAHGLDFVPESHLFSIHAPEEHVAQTAALAFPFQKRKKKKARMTELTSVCPPALFPAPLWTVSKNVPSPSKSF